MYHDLQTQVTSPRHQSTQSVLSMRGNKTESAPQMTPTEYPAPGATIPKNESTIGQTKGTTQPRTSILQGESARNGDNRERGWLNYIGGWFNYAYGFTINHPLMAEHIHINKQASIDLLWLEGHAMSGVELHSEARAPHPQCYQGTRLKLIQIIQSWLREPDSTRKLLWLSGPAGVGKSAIMQTVAEGEEKLDRLGATLFFPRMFSSSETSPPTQRGTPPRLWITIAYRLAIQCPSYLAYVEDRMSRDPTLVNSKMEHQFDTLIAGFFGRENSDAPSHALSIFIDGLDHFHTIDTQKRVIQLVTNFIREYPSAPLVWIVAGRREAHFVKVLNEGQDKRKEIHSQFIPVESQDALADVELFLRGRFDEIQVDYNDVIELPWPEVEDLSRLLLAASGLFLFATAVMNFIADSYIANPPTQLQSVLSSIIFAPPDSERPLKPLETVHDMYAQILGAIPPDSYPMTKRILGFFVLPSGFSGWVPDATPFWSLCNILNIAKHDAYSCLTMLHSLLDIPTPQNAIWTPLRPFHSSFPGYLIDPMEVMADFWKCHFRVLREINAETGKAPEISRMQLSWSSSPEDDEELKVDTWENGRRALFHHLLPCSSDPCPFGIHLTDLSDNRYSSQFVEAFKKINFRVLVDGYVSPDVPYRFVEFLDWLSREEHIPLLKNNLLQKVNLVDRRFDWIDNVAASFKITSTNPAGNPTDNGDGGRTLMIKAYRKQGLSEPDKPDLNRPFSTGEQAEPLTELLDCPGLGDVSTALLVGSKAVGQCVVFVSTLARDRTYYVFPCDPLSTISQN